MKLCLLSAILLLFALPSFALPSFARIPETAPALQLGSEEKQFFALGMTLSRGAFAYAELAKQASAIARTGSSLGQVRQLSRLDPIAGRNRSAARREISQAEALMRQLRAPESALDPVTAAGVRLAGPLPMTSDARSLAFFSRSAARTVSSLSEFETLSSLPDDPAIRQWLNAPAQARSAQVWFGQGQIAGLAQIAAEREMPDLLPSTAQIAAGLRGLRDWLVLRPPEMPSTEQAALKLDLDSFLQEAAASVPSGVKPRTLLAPPQLQTLGRISRRLQSQVLGTVFTGLTLPASNSDSLP